MRSCPRRSMHIGHVRRVAVPCFSSSIIGSALRSTPVDRPNDASPRSGSISALTPFIRRVTGMRIAGHSVIFVAASCPRRPASCRGARIECVMPGDFLVFLSQRPCANGVLSTPLASMRRLDTRAIHRHLVLRRRDRSDRAALAAESPLFPVRQAFRSSPACAGPEHRSCDSGFFCDANHSFIFFDPASAVLRRRAMSMRGAVISSSHSQASDVDSQPARPDVVGCTDCARHGARRPPRARANHVESSFESRKQLASIALVRPGTSASAPPAGALRPPATGNRRSPCIRTARHPPAHPALQAAISSATW